MTTLSWPVTNTDYTHALYREGMAGQDGIIDDLGGDAFHLTLPSTGDNATISAGGKYRLRGYVLQVSADHTVNLPAVAAGGAAKTYCLGVKYDPTLESDSGGPLTFFALQKGTFAGSGGVVYAQLYEVTRSASQVLSAAAVVDQRAWAAAMFYGAPGSAAAPNAWPVGARLATADGVQRLRVPLFTGGVASGTAWQVLNTPTWQALTLASGLTAQATTPAYAKVGSEVVIRGGVARSDGTQLAAGNVSITIATLPAGYRPGVLMRFAVGSSYLGDAVNGRVQVDTTGLLTFITPFAGGSFTSLDGIRFWAEG